MKILSSHYCLLSDLSTLSLSLPVSLCRAGLLAGAWSTVQARDTHSRNLPTRLLLSRVSHGCGSAFLPRDALYCRRKAPYIAIAYCPSVRLSVTLVDQNHIGWISWKLIARTISLTLALRSPKAIHLFPGEHGEILGRLEVGKKKCPAGAQKRQYL